MSGNLPALPSDSSWTPVARVSGGKLHCRCVCGTERVALVGAFTRRNRPSRSCGCERAQRVSIANRTHGHAVGYAHSPEYATWHSMVQRCENPKHKRYDRYGGRGITVCVAWRVFENFFADMGTRPSRRHSIDRRDNDLGYDCGKCGDCLGRGATANCRWATHLEQMSNRSITVMLTIEGERRSLAEWARVLGVDYSAFQMRLANKWPIERAVAEAFRNETPWARRDRLLRAVANLPALRGFFLRGLYGFANDNCKPAEGLVRRRRRATG